MCISKILWYAKKIHTGQHVVTECSENSKHDGDCVQIIFISDQIFYPFKSMFQGLFDLVLKMINETKTDQQMNRKYGPLYCIVALGKQTEYSLFYFRL